MVKFILYFVLSLFLFSASAQEGKVLLSNGKINAQQSDFGIISPKQPVNGSKYSVQNPSAYTIQWNSDNPKIATIDPNGVLHVVGNGIVRITAKRGTSIESSMEVMVSTPKFVLEDAVRKPGFYEIKSKCIDAQYADFLSKYNNVLSYKWGVKTNNQPLVWFVSESPELRVSTLEDNDNANRTIL